MIEWLRKRANQESLTEVVKILNEHKEAQWLARLMEKLFRQKEASK